MSNNTGLSLKDKVKTALVKEETGRPTRLGWNLLIATGGVVLGLTAWGVKVAVSTAVTGTPTVG